MPLRILVLDHFFGQDIDALRQAGHSEGFEFDILPFEHLRAEALRVLPAAVASGLSAIEDPSVAVQRERWRSCLRRILIHEFARSRCDALVVPSDVFFYVRDAARICHALRVPFIVVQKETTISNHTMEVHSQEVRRWAPPIADKMFVCSERHREFWLRTGARPESVVVTGQPRFDFYQNQAMQGSRQELSGPRALFFSYELDAYYPIDGVGDSADLQPWRRLHEQTLEGLLALVRQGWHVTIKPHPQQNLEESLLPWFKNLSGKERRLITVAAGSKDARRLVVDADVVIGFQTTALIEACIAGRPTVYTGWDACERSMTQDLIAFDEIESPMRIVRTPDAFVPAVLESLKCQQTAFERERVRAFGERYLGPMDGLASKRVLVGIRDHIADAALEQRSMADAALCDASRHSGKFAAVPYVGRKMIRRVRFAAVRRLNRSVS